MEIKFDKDPSVIKQNYAINSYIPDLEILLTISK